MPIPAGPTAAAAWAPSLPQVATYVPERTVTLTTPGEESALNTFSDDTTPTSAQVTDFITAAVRHVQMKVGASIDATLYDAATAAAAMRTAGLVELSYPVRDGDLNVGDRWIKLADDAIEQIRTANADPTAGTRPDPLLPVYSFPDPPVYGDIPL